MSRVQQTLAIPAPVRQVYNQWTQFEGFPAFMEGVESVTQLDDKRLHWKAEVAGQELEWDAEITEQVPDTRIAWRNTTGRTNAGVVDFHRLDEARCEVSLAMDVEPEGLKEQVGEKLGFLDRQVKGDLERFKKLMEEDGSGTRGWRGEVAPPHAH